MNETVRKIGHFMVDWLPDSLYLKLKFWIVMKKRLNLHNPVTYTEKLQWLKLNDRKDIYSMMVDKNEAKKFVSDIIGEEYIIPTYGVWNSAEEIDFDCLPHQFVLKCTHDSGSVIVCKDKDIFDAEHARHKLQKSLATDAFIAGREWPYKNVTPKIIAEKYMEDSTYRELRDYKFFTFNGEPKVLYIAQGRGLGGETTADFFDMDFNVLPFTIDHDHSNELPPCPENFELMKTFAAKLSKGTPQLRVDFYEVDGKVYFGELTFFHCSGFSPFHPEEWDYKFGEWVELPNKL